MSLPVAFEISQATNILREISGKLDLTSNEVFIDLPMTLGWWPMTSVTQGGDAINIVGFSDTRLVNNSILYGFDTHAFCETDLPGSFLRASTVLAGNATGIASWIDTSQIGLTVGCWVYLLAGPALTTGVVTKWGSSGSRSWSMNITSSDEVEFEVSFDGTVDFGVQSSAIPLNTWTFVVGRIAFSSTSFPSSAVISVFVDQVKSIDSITATSGLFLTPSFMEIGRYRENSARITNARIRDVFVCASALSDDQIETVRLSSLPPTM